MTSRRLSLLASAALLSLNALAADAPAPDAKPADKPKWDVNHPPGP